MPYRSSSLLERVLGLLSPLAVFAALWWAAEQRVPLVVAIPVSLAALALIAGWICFHRLQESRAPHTRLENLMGSAAAITLGLPAGNTLWDTPDNTVGIVVPAAVPALALLVHLVSRWRA
ncbi:hypothetical protein [Streptomyces sp. NPDC059009]|uniref:hypothetical protein n=1 Tax=Streptomyces sp. NPDC059009 TaxID=3346694 RepID=UPI0036C32313